MSGFVASVLLLAAECALAQASPATQVPINQTPINQAPATPAPALAMGASSLAKELFWQGNDAFQGGRFLQAIELYTRAFELSHEPALLFNLAECHRRLGACDAARAAYTRYRAAEPNPPDAARDWVAQSGGACAEGAPIQLLVPEVSAPALVPAPSPPTAEQQPPPAAKQLRSPAAEQPSPAASTQPREPQRPAPPSEHPERSNEERQWPARHVVAWSLIGVGVVSAAGATWAAVGASDAQADADHAAQRLIDSDTPWDAEGEPLERTAEDRRALALGFGITGVVLVATGVLLRFTGDDATSADRGSARRGLLAAVNGTGAAVSWGGEF